MVRRSSRFDSSEGAGTSSSGKIKKEEEKKPIAVQKVPNTKKTAIVKPPKPAPKAPKAAPPRAIYTAADVQRLKAEVEKCIRDKTAHEEKREKMIAEQTKEIKELEESDQTTKEENITTLEKFAIEDCEERKKKTTHEKDTKKFERKVMVQKSLNQTRALSAHFLNRSETLEKWQSGANGGAARPWKQCELCHVQWSQVGDSVPRILDCGHTMCDKCTKKFVVDGNKINCPFDEKTTYGAGTIPKNYTLLNM
ncbi:hypothetical protein CAEBREN_17564 [Caenorhabditis brenneri]|uniref:RING-type domain-containing protein n=1 Tax=Caenorhabditis brenneri TaxID=135651 RepID=G0NET3_CAEBE|nr:hypothetical protein CAEBREN_17564 [Caenorhabditis brenneri]